jgi:hypothetical protein
MFVWMHSLFDFKYTNCSCVHECAHENDLVYVHIHIICEFENLQQANVDVFMYT